MNAMDSYAPLLSLNNEHYPQKCCGAITCICDVQGNKGEDSTRTRNPSPSDTESESDGWSDASSLDPLSDATPPTIPAYPSSVPGPIDFMVLDSSLDDAVGNMSAIFLKYIQAFPPSTSAHELHDALQNLYDILRQVEELARWIDEAEVSDWNKAQYVHALQTVFFNQHVEWNSDSELSE
ncbi:uncharacterized protein EV420DRAFT_1485586 [Desarmillaria tabescens]|uniref:Uncharacterized protein n=1 Tax=Armillaria tabescens TaxID=1929756 RepID=A0AA39MPS0_ARMTA|nr:uncharacterized protein EV420DRAFT_1485586 [Desarmillaria tabescens]KAK0441514.1 hypothetical protein EV420DRAFT_1485586 [Desarmillaria tabescens]